MVKNIQSINFEDFGGGLNVRDDEISLPLNESPRIQNIEIVKETGLQKLQGFTELFDLPDGFCVREFFNYTDDDGRYRYIAIAYPEIISIDPDTGNFEVIYSDLVGTGDPEAWECDGKLFLVDGQNGPIVIDKDTVTDLTSTGAWPPSYTNANNAVGNLDQNQVSTAANPAAGTIGQPTFGVWHTNRVFLAGDPLNPRRIYASKLLDITDFSDNDPDDFNIAFFVDVPTSRPITGLKVISNQHLVVYCDREIILLTGENPPGTAYPQPHYDFRTLNTEVGALFHRLIVSRGDNDHFFVSGNGRVFQLSLTSNFQEVKPLGLTEKIFPLLATRTNETFTRGRLINFQLRGELLFWTPSTNQRRYPDQTLVLNYGDSPQSSVWSRNQSFGDLFTFQSGVINRNTNKLVITDGKNFMQTNTGTSFNGNSIKTLYQLSSLDFAQPYNFKEVSDIVVYARSSTGAIVQLNHTWDSGESGVINFEIPATPESIFGEADFGENDFLSSAGQAFSQIKFAIANPVGKILKIAIQHDSDTEDFTINKIGINYRMMGKE